MTITAEPTTETPAWARSAIEAAKRHGVPLLALSPAAYISWQHMAGPMGYNPYVSGVIAFALEVLGYVTIDTLLSALHAKRWGAAIASGASFVGYISIIVSLNTALNVATLIAPQVLAWAKVVAEAALVMLTVPAALWAGAREILRKAETHENATVVFAANERAESEQRQLDARRKEKQDAIAGKIELAKLANATAQPVAQPPATAPQPVSGKIDHAQLVAALVANPNATPTELAKLLHVSRPAVTKHIDKFGKV